MFRAVCGNISPGYRTPGFYRSPPLRHPAPQPARACAASPIPRRLWLGHAPRQRGARARQPRIAFARAGRQGRAAAHRGGCFATLDCAFASADWHLREKGKLSPLWEEKLTERGSNEGLAQLGCGLHRPVYPACESPAFFQSSSSPPLLLKGRSVRLSSSL